MARLTDRRFGKARIILDNYKDKLQRLGSFDAMSLERELKKVWNVGYQKIKSIMFDLAKREEYKPLVAYFAENINIHVVSEYQQLLSKIYGAQYYLHGDYDQLRTAFWNKYKENHE